MSQLVAEEMGFGWGWKCPFPKSVVGKRLGVRFMFESSNAFDVSFLIFQNCFEADLSIFSIIYLLV